MKNELIDRKSGLLARTMLICSIMVFLFISDKNSLSAAAADTTGGGGNYLMARILQDGSMLVRVLIMSKMD